MLRQEPQQSSTAERIIGYVRGYRLIEKRSMLGHPYVIWEDPMPRISDLIQDTIVYLYPSEKDAKDSASVGATGFLVHVYSKHYPRNPRRGFDYVVTNKHVAEKARFVRINTTGGQFDILEADWKFHENGDDVAVSPIQLSRMTHKIQTLGEKFILDQKTCSELYIGLGDDVFMMGRFIHFEGTERNIPTSRFGNIAMMNVEPLIDGDGFPQESFLVEMRTIPGYSGSPVFVTLPKVRWEDHPEFREQADARGSLTWLLGIEWMRSKASLDELQTPWINGQPVTVRVTTGMSGVIPAWKIRDVLDCDKFRTQREYWDMMEAERKKNSRIEKTFAEKPKQSSLAPDPRDRIDIPTPTREQFERDFTKATRKRKPSG
ncbi:MAG TPA: hypothetical protein VMU16_14915 [Candidatus Binataceae bacterium]|nr:hypothetical protein [Candidatus Binataceae bacterium]